MEFSEVRDPAYVGAATTISNTAGGDSINITPLFALASADGTPLTPFATGNVLTADPNSNLSFGYQTVLPTSWQDIAFQALIMQYQTELTGGSSGEISVTLDQAAAAFSQVLGTVGEVPSADFSAVLTTASDAAISQQVDVPPSDPVSLSFEYLFRTVTGELSVILDDTLLATITASSVLGTDLSPFSVAIPPELLGRSNVDLEFLLQGPTGSSVALDIPRIGINCAFLM